MVRRLTASAAGDRLPAGPAPAGATGLEPATCGFGDRCATNCATPLRGATSPATRARRVREAFHPTADQCTGSAHDYPTDLPTHECARLPEHLLTGRRGGQLDLE